MKIIQPNETIKARGHYSPAVLSNGLLFVSGQVPTDANGAMPQGIEAQTALCLEKIERILKQTELTRSNVVMCRAFVKDESCWEPLNRVYGEFFGEHRPARIIVPTPALREGLLVEIEVIAEAN